MEILKVNLAEKLEMFSEHWSPRIIGALNGQHVKVVKLKGSFLWHKHDKEDELFLVLEGVLKIHMRNKSLTLNKGEFVIIPRGIEHLPEAEEEVHALLFEPASTLNTGDKTGDLTVDNPEWI